MLTYLPCVLSVNRRDVWQRLVQIILMVLVQKGVDVWSIWDQLKRDCPNKVDKDVYHENRIGMIEDTNLERDLFMMI